MKKEKYLAEMILSVVADVTGTTKEELKGKCRKENLAKARGLFCVTCSNYGIKNEVAILTINRGRLMQYHYIKVYRGYIETDRKLNKQYQEIKKILNKIKNSFF